MSHRITDRGFNSHSMLTVCLLIALLPAIKDGTLFYFATGNSLQVVYHGEFVEKVILLSLLVLTVIIGVVQAIRSRMLFAIVGFLPTVMMFLLFVSRDFVVLDLGLVSIIQAIFYKITFLLVAFKGQLRSVYAKATIALFLLFAPFLNVILFVLSLGFIKMIQLVWNQNKETLRNVNRKVLMNLIVKTARVWSPILLFGIPAMALTSFLVNLAKEQVYKRTFINHYNLKTDKGWDDLYNYNVNEKLKDQNLSVTNDRELELALTNSLRIVQYKSDSLWYANYTEGIRDFRNSMDLFIGAVDHDDVVGYEFIKSYASQDLFKVLVERFLPGRTEFELDLIISSDLLYQRIEDEAKSMSDSVFHNVEQKLDSIKQDIRDEVFKAKLSVINANHNIQLDIMKTSIQAQEEINKVCQSTRDSLFNALDSANQKIQDLVSVFPVRMETYFESKVPKTLIEVDEHALNLMKALLREVYVRQREKAKVELIKSSNEISEWLSAIVSDANAAMKDEVESRVAELNESLLQLSKDVESSASQIANNGSALIEAKIADLSSEIDNKIEWTRHEVRALNDKNRYYISKTYYAASSVTEDTLLLVYRVLYFTGIISTILFWTVVIRSFLYVFSRVSFQGDNGLYVEISGEETEDNFNSVIHTYGNHYVIDQEKERFYVGRRFLPTGHSPKIAIPKPGQCSLPRILSGTYLMNVISPESRDVEFKATGSLEFVEWNLSASDEVVFSLLDLVAFTESINFYNQYSFRITSTFLGKVKYTIARGPGKLVLLGNGKVLTSNRQSNVPSFSVARLLTWDKSAKFSIDSQMGLADMYLSNVYLKSRTQDLVVINADPGQAVRKVGLARFILSFLLPI